jgi:hypothetical protein
MLSVYINVDAFLLLPERLNLTGTFLILAFIMNQLKPIVMVQHLDAVADADLIMGQIGIRYRKMMALLINLNGSQFHD